MAVEIEELLSCSWISWFDPISTWTSIHQHESQAKICSQSLRGPVSHDPWFPKVQSWCESWSHGDVLMPCPVLRRRFSEGMHLDVVNSTSLMVVNDDYTWTWIALVCYWIKGQRCLLARIHEVFFSRNWWVDLHVLWWFGHLSFLSVAFAKHQSGHHDHRWQIQGEPRETERQCTEMYQGFLLQNFPGNGKVLVVGKCRKLTNDCAPHFQATQLNLDPS